MESQRDPSGKDRISSVSQPHPPNISHSIICTMQAPESTFLFPAYFMAILPPGRRAERTTLT